MTLIVAVLTIVVGAGTLWALGLELRHITTNVFVVALCVGTQVLLRLGRVRRATQAFIFVLWLTITWSCLRLGGTHSVVLATYSPVIATTAVLMSRRAGLVYAALSAAAITAFFVAEIVLGWVPPPNDLTPALSGLVLAAAALMTGGIIYLAAGQREDSDRRARESERVFTELVRTAPEGIVTLDAAGVVASVNPAAEAMFGYPAAWLSGRPLVTLAGFEQAAQWSEGSTVALPFERPDGSTRELEVERRPLAIAGRPGARVSVRDVTDRRAAERERAQLIEQLHHSQKQESIGLLASGIAHDFNNLITASLLNLEVAGQQELNPTARECVDSAVEVILRSAELTRQLLAFSRRQVLSTRDVAVNEVVSGVQSMLRRLLVESIELRFELKATGIIRADPAQLGQVLLNLAVNARDAMPQGGVLTISTADVEAGGVCLSVQDTGAGMPPDVAARIFEPFFTTKPVGKGTGLGLAVVDGIVRQSGGTVKLDTAPGKGTRFELSFPSVEGAAPEGLVAGAVAAPGSGGGRAVLVVEDEPLLREAVGRELERAGFKVHSCADGEEALRQAEQLPELALVVTDVVMPRLNGPETVRRLRQRRPELKALFMSGYADQSLHDLGVVGTANAFIAKPLRPHELLRATFGLLQGAVRWP